MIVTSKRCFLNVLTQLLTPEQLIHANYYIGDSADRYNMGGNTQVNINGMGEITYDDSFNNQQSSFYTYAVKHSGCLNPEATNSPFSRSIISYLRSSADLTEFRS